MLVRVEEHKADIKYRNYDKVVPRHCNNGHNINPEKVSVLDFETNTSKRLLSEMINIHLQDYPINLKDDTRELHDSCRSLMCNLFNCK